MFLVRDGESIGRACLSAAESTYLCVRETVRVSEEGVIRTVCLFNCNFVKVKVAGSALRDHVG